MSADQSAVQREADFFFSQKVRTEGFTAQLTNCALCLIKPHAVAQNFAGNIMERILDEGFEISAIQSYFLNRAQAEEFMQLYRPFIADFSHTIDQLVSGPCIAMEIRQENVV